MLQLSFVPMFILYSILIYVHASSLKWAYTNKHYFGLAYLVFAILSITYQFINVLTKNSLKII
jgi:hypothetical protein